MRLIPLIRSGQRANAVKTAALATAAIFAHAALTLGADATGPWPQFRGPTGQGIADAAALPVHWSETEGVKWKTALPGRAWSSPVIANGHIWVTTAEERETGENAEDPKGGQPARTAAEVKLSAIRIDLASGEADPPIELFTVAKPPAIHGLNSFASPTPVIADGRVVCHFGTMGTACVDAESGAVLWRRKFEINHIVGPGSSPVVHNGMAILTCDGGDKQFIVAVDLKSGDDVWTVDRPPMREENPDLKKAYCTPLIYTAGGREQMVIPGAQWFIAYDPSTGKEIWRIDHGAGYSNVPAPVCDGEKVYLDTGFNKGQLWAVRADGTGDVSETHVAWRQTQQMPTMPSPVMADGRIFVISDGGVATCLDAESGKVVWRQRVPGQYSASPLLGAGLVYFCSHEGVTTVIAATDEFKKLAENTLDGKLMASPAVAEGDLILRTDTHLYRIATEKE
jgi:outer membrane protein assembly factor BamB